MAGEDQHRFHEPDHEAVCWLATGFRHPHARGPQIAEALPDPSERLWIAQWIHHRTHVQQSIRMGEERARGGRLRTQNSRAEVSAFHTERRA